MKISFNRNINILNEKVTDVTSEEKNKYLRSLEEMKNEFEKNLANLRQEKDTTISKLSSQRDNLCVELESLEREKNSSGQKMAALLEELNKLKLKLKKYEKDISDSEVR